MKRLRRNCRSIMAFVLVIALLSTSCAFAGETVPVESTSNDEITSQLSEFEYKDSNNATAESYTISLDIDGSYSVAQNGEGIIISRYDAFDSIYSAEGKIFFQKQDDKFVEVCKKTVKLNDPELRSKLTSCFPNKEIVDDIAKKAQCCLDNEAEVVFFTDLVTNRGTWTTTTWGSYTFHHYIVDVQGYWTPYKTLASGDDTTFNFLNSLTTFTLSVAGIFSQAASVFGAGLSALQFFADSVEYCDQRNYIQAAVKGNWYTKYTYMNYMGVDQYGCISHLIDFTKIDTVEFFISSGNGIRKHNESQFVKTCYSPFYTSPEPMAYSVVTNGLDVYNDYIRLKVEAGTHYKYFYFQ